MQVWDDILNMLATPFVGSLDITHLFLLVGIVLIFIFAWAIILNHIQIAAMEI